MTPIGNRTTANLAQNTANPEAAKPAEKSLLDKAKLPGAAVGIAMLASGCATTMCSTILGPTSNIGNLRDAAVFGECVRVLSDAGPTDPVDAFVKAAVAGDKSATLTLNPENKGEQQACSTDKPTFSPITIRMG